MGASGDVIELVRTLVAAENKGGEEGRAHAEGVLAHYFGVITRAGGVEEARDALLKAIGAEPNRKKKKLRTLEDEFCVRVFDRVAAVRSVVGVSEGEENQPLVLTGRFRNMHLFENQDGQWRCIAWQVTRLEHPPAKPNCP